MLGDNAELPAERSKNTSLLDETEDPQPILTRLTPASAGRNEIPTASATKRIGDKPKSVDLPKKAGNDKKGTKKPNKEKRTVPQASRQQNPRAKRRSHTSVASTQTQQEESESSSEQPDDSDSESWTPAATEDSDDETSDNEQSRNHPNVALRNDKRVREPGARRGGRKKKPPDR